MDWGDVAKLSHLLFYCCWAVPLFFPIRGHRFGLELPPLSETGLRPCTLWEVQQSLRLCLSRFQAGLSTGGAFSLPLLLFPLSMTHNEGRSWNC